MGVTRGFWLGSQGQQGDAKCFFHLLEMEDLACPGPGKHCEVVCPIPPGPYPYMTPITVVLDNRIHLYSLECIVDVVCPRCGIPALGNNTSQPGSVSAYLCSQLGPRIWE